MHKYHDCNECVKYSVCKFPTVYNNTALELTDTNTDDFVSKLQCKHYEEKKK